MSVSEEERLFSSGSSDLYEPSEEDITSSEEVESNKKQKSDLIRPKRKVSRQSEWKRNVRTRLMTEGKPYKTVSGKDKSRRVVGRDCMCKYKCFDKLTEHEKLSLLDSFNKLGEKRSQDIYLGGRIAIKAVNRRRVKTGHGQPRAFSGVYSVRIGDKKERVCKKAFASLHGISCKRIENIASHIFKNKAITPKPDGRGKHKNRPNKVDDEKVKKVYDHIASFPTRESHYSRKDNVKRKYLSADLDITQMHKLYLQIHPESPVSYDFYFRYFKANFNLAFGSPRSDTCQKCDCLKNEMCSPSISENRRKELELQKNLHLSKAQKFYDALKETQARAVNEDNVEMLCFDYQQNMPLPKVPSGDAFYKRQCWVYNFGISSAKSAKHYFYIYDESVGKKTPNEPISFLHHYIHSVMSEDIKVLYLFSDNCVSQNKNHALTQYLFFLVKSGRLNTVIHRFPEPGHSFMPCDRAFGNIEKRMRKVERVFVPREYTRIIEKTSKKFTVKEVTQEMIFNFVDLLKGFFLKTPHIISNGIKKEKFLITKFRVFTYEISHINAGNILGSESVGILCNKTVRMFNIQNSTPIILNNLQQAYTNHLPLKAAKYKDVMDLAQKYVAQNDMWFYNRLQPDNAPDDPDVTEGECDD